MNLTTNQLKEQYHRARKYAGELIDSVEDEFELPAFSLYAIGSRETNFDPHWLTNPGDNGNGHGWWQIDKRYHEIPDDWHQDIEWQCRKGAEVFSDCLGAADDEIIPALNRYNSGQEKSQYTTGKDYGPDTESRRQNLIQLFGTKTEGEEFVANKSLVNLNSGLAIDVSGASKDDRAPVIQWNVTGKKNQSIELEDVGNGLHRIKFEHSGKYLDADPNRFEAVQYARADVPGQLWRVNREPNGAFVIASEADGRVLDVAGESTELGASLILWEKKGSADGTVANQQFVIVNFR